MFITGIRFALVTVLGDFMMKLSRGLVLALMISTALAPAIAAAKPAAVAVPTVNTPSSNPLAVTWPQDSSDMAPDPAARFGRLPNGMTYVIYKNATPPGTIAMHLRINAGSLMENDNERGLAHFVEHMAFNGSRNIPKDELLPLMQRHGLKLGPDAGAFTLPNKTEYVFDLPSNDEESVDTALLIAREISGNLLFDEGAVERERSVVLGEERLRQSPLQDSQTRWLAAAFAGQKYATRGSPIGLAQIIRNAPRQTVVDFYHAFYRPELTTLIIVGDVDPDAVETRIKSRFSDWTGEGPARAVDFGAYRKKGVAAMAEQAASLPDTVTAAWFRPLTGKAMGVAETDQVMLDVMVSSILTRRIQYFAQKPEAGLVGGSVVVLPIAKTALVTQVSVIPKPGRGADALTYTMRAVKQVTTYGATQSEIDEAVKTFGGVFQGQVSGARTRTNEAIIENMVSNLDVNSVFTSPQQDLAWFNGFKQRLTPDVVKAHAQAMFSGDGPLLEHTAEDLGGFDAKALKSAYKAAMKVKVPAFGSADAKDWPYTDFGPIQTPVAEQARPDFGFTRYSFANNVTLNLMPTQFKDDEVKVSVAFRGGLQTLAPDSDAPVGMTAFYAALGGFLGGGTGKLDRSELSQTLAGQTVEVNYSLGENAATLDATTTRGDLTTQLQLMMAFATDAAYNPDMYNQIQGALPAVYTQLTASPQGILNVNLAAATHAGDKRFLFPDLAQAQAVPFEAVRDLLKATLANAPVEITLVGDFDPAEALKQVELTFGNLSMTPQNPRLAVGGDIVHFPTTDLDRTYYHNGRADQSLSLVAWPLPDELSDSQRSRGLQVLAEILNARVFAQIRQQLGQAYDANATREQSVTFKDYGMMQVSGSVAAGQDGAFRDAVAAIVNDLQAHPVTQDELDRARKPLLERWEDQQKDNGHWISVVPHLVEDPARGQAELHKRDELLAVTPDMVMALAKAWLVDAKALHIKILPRPAKP